MTMEYRHIAGTDLKLSVITFGSWAAGSWMWGKTDRNDAIAAIRAACDLGVTSIDTAPVYGQGDSENIVGEAISGISRDKVQILTKFGLRWDAPEGKGKFFFKSQDNDGKPIDIVRYAGKESVIAECEASLKRLKTDYIDLYQIHWPDKSTPMEETFDAVGRLIEQGKVRYAGVSNYTAAQMAEAEKILPIVSNQIPFSMINRGIEAETVPYCIEHNKAILAYSPLERGVLTGKIKPGHVFAEGDHRADYRFYTDENLVKINAFLEKLKPLAEAKNATLAQLVLRWTIDRPGITIALAGARNAAQATANAHAVDIALDPDEIAFIDENLPEI
ncbi:aldo/keto reductase [Oxalobacter paraformigenes]|uniref:NADP-dependent oxidoreductase domain-containing protein n=1 Tax=Oxalobacter paraformigenes TaxID=556268 RepID=C3X471_9BURK|nr:aldo/keto reductase [Oxalobacter paraformigenes]EEO28007.1 hypothetical protein OFAG_01160 [Oxalobacter paraformigenes]